MSFPLLLAIFFIVPLIEIYFLIQVGGVIGAGWTIFAVVFTAVLGAILVRRQGFTTLNRIRGHMDAGELPAIELLEGLCLLMAGALLLTPGFFTDAFGFLLLTPPLRRWAIARILASGIVTGRMQSASFRVGGERPLEGDYTRIDD